MPCERELLYLTIRPVARKGYGAIAHEAKPNVCVSANHPYSQPEGWIAKGSTGSAECIWKAPLAAAKRSWMIPEHRSTAARPNVFDLGKGQTTTLRALLFTNSVWVL